LCGNKDLKFKNEKEARVTNSEVLGISGFTNEKFKTAIISFHVGQIKIIQPADKISSIAENFRQVTLTSKCFIYLAIKNLREA